MGSPRLAKLQIERETMGKRRVFSWMLNVISVVCAAIVIWQFGRSYFTSSARPSDATVPIGAKIQLPGISWSDSPRTVVLALSAKCQYCRLSARFYRSLIGAAEPQRFRVVAAMREPIEESKSDLVALGLEGLRDIRQTDLQALRIRGTPTLLIVNRRGTVEASWTGNLPADQQEAVFTALKVPVPPQAKPPQVASDSALQRVGANELRILLRDPGAVVLDVRERSRFYEAHLVGALNMPLDEIVPRAPHELPQDRTILVYCIDYSTCSIGPRKFQSIFCQWAAEGLNYVGISNVRPIADDLATLADQGLPVQGKPCRIK
jgi:hypothetical protein